MQGFVEVLKKQSAVSILSKCACPRSSGSQSQGCWSSFTFACCWAEPWPGWHHHLPFLPFWSTKNVSFSVVGHVVGASRENTKWEADFACFLNHIDSFKTIYLQIECSVAWANFMSCLHAKAKMHHLSCNNANHQFPTREQSPIDVGTRKQGAKKYPNRKKPKTS